MNSPSACRSFSWTPGSTTSLHSAPEIYFGEVPNEYCLVKTQAKELDMLGR
jgi:uncharacterized membrane protein (UPF0182 family)